MTTPEIIPEHLRELIARNNNVTIERCARVAEEYIGIGNESADIIARAIAAAIRKLKDPVAEAGA